MVKMEIEMVLTLKKGVPHRKEVLVLLVRGKE